MNVELVRYLSIISVAIYFCFDYFDGKRVKDEREEFIRLKTFELIHKVTITALTLFSVAVILYPEIPAALAVLVFVFAFMYAEIFGKLYLRSKY
jgi:hypothetical protein